MIWHRKLLTLTFLCLVLRGINDSHDNSSVLLRASNVLILNDTPQFHCRRLHKSTSSPSTAPARVCLDILRSASIALLLVCLSNDVQLNPGPQATNHATNVHLPCIPLSKNGVRMCHWNARSFNNDKYEQIKEILTHPRTEIDVMIITETWLSSSHTNEEYGIPGYHIERKDRTRKERGGVMMYVSHAMAYTRLPTLESSDTELLCTQVIPCKSNCPIIIAGVYRVPNSTAVMDVKLEGLIGKIYITNKEALLLGDFNINFLKQQNHKHRLIKFLTSLGFTQTINEVTRPESHSCLDHVYTNQPQCITKTKVWNIGLSDHLPVCVVRRYKKKQDHAADKNHVYISYRDCKKLDEEALLKDPVECAGHL
ncbi:predicted protein [Nematostella vectensis]|uniref:Endonuclease/exonuclease/phosphatase domain-containing protein n=2 Tax=Nematostella vectensis TaxID=45351 RepID=A7SM53_NEMVE|nr:predicted protein [Nematostella vectensis]|eukprot:XP_001627324.1 predicted protein [Nematostella vectensis]